MSLSAYNSCVSTFYILKNDPATRYLHNNNFRLTKKKKRSVSKKKHNTRRYIIRFAYSDPANTARARGRRFSIKLHQLIDVLVHCRRNAFGIVFDNPQIA